MPNPIAGVGARLATKLGPLPVWGWGAIGAVGFVALPIVARGLGGGGSSGASDMMATNKGVAARPVPAAPVGPPLLIPGGQQPWNPNEMVFTIPEWWHQIRPRIPNVIMESADLVNGAQESFGIVSAPMNAPLANAPSLNLLENFTDALGNAFVGFQGSRMIFKTPTGDLIEGYNEKLAEGGFIRDVQNAVSGEIVAIGKPIAGEALPIFAQSPEGPKYVADLQPHEAIPVDAKVTAVGGQIISLAEGFSPEQFQEALAS